jgi:hypothetical protein
MSLPSRLLGANPSIQVSTLLSGSLTTPSAKSAFIPPGDFESIATVSVGSGGAANAQHLLLFLLPLRICRYAQQHGLIMQIRTMDSKFNLILIQAVIMLATRYIQMVLL